MTHTKIIFKLSVAKRIWLTPFTSIILKRTKTGHSRWNCHTSHPHWSSSLPVLYSSGSRQLGNNSLQPNASFSRTSLWTKSFLNGIKKGWRVLATSVPASRKAVTAIKHGPTGPFREGNSFLFLEHSTKLGGTIQASKIVPQQVRRNNSKELGSWSWAQQSREAQDNHQGQISWLPFPGADISWDNRCAIHCLVVTGKPCDNSPSTPLCDSWRDSAIRVPGLYSR